MEQVVATDIDALKSGFISAPENPEEWQQWREKLKNWRETKLKELGKPLYDSNSQSWASEAYSQGFIMLWDNELIDHKTGEWKVESLLDRADRDFGGYDLVVLWNNYPLSGIDNRHQIAYFDELPGGRQALAKAVSLFHQRGVRVLIDHKPWVKGVPEGYTCIEDALIELAKYCNLDGFFLDCQDGPSDYFRKTVQEKLGADKIFISEAPARLDPFGNEIASWQQMTDDSAAPGIYRNRWLDRNQIVYESRRYFHDPIKEIQRAWMNGGGFVVWENVFGYWAEYSERCKSWLRLMFPAQRFFSEFFIKGEWNPHVGGGTVNGIYVTEWKLEDKTLWTAVNRRGHTIEKTIFKVPAKFASRYFDVISGQEYRIVEEKDGYVSLAGWFERDGLAGILAIQNLSAELNEFIQKQRERFGNADWTVLPWKGEHRKTTLPHILVSPIKTSSNNKISNSPNIPKNMVRIPDFDGWMVTRYRMRECGYIAGAIDELHVYDAFEKVCTYSRKATVKNVAIDIFPVTNSDFLEFLNATGYKPKDNRNFLKHWVNGKPRPGEERHPVVYVSFEDARAYAEWAGKRLPTEEEWQAAAHNPSKGEWPWGAEPPQGRCNSGSNGTTPVDAFPNGRSHCGAWDMSGNVWEMTESERTDGHTRYRIIKGGGWYYVDNSFWLFDTGARPADWGAKQILLCEAWDRCSTIGFRCVKDLT